jgi:radical SAM protein with 4Fe4S-binding SPASM domain
MGEKYNPEKHDRKQIKKEQLAKTCDKCESSSTCTTPCPDVLGYVDQDYASRREVYLREPHHKDNY